MIRPHTRYQDAQIIKVWAGGKRTPKEVRALLQISSIYVVYRALRRKLAPEKSLKSP